MATISDAFRPLDALVPNLRNYNDHSRPETIQKMAARIRHHGFTAPCIVNSQDLLLGGHLRRLALLKLREEHYPEPEGVKPGWLVPCRVFEGTPVQELAVLAGDNPDPADLEYDTEGLASLLSELQTQGELTGAGYTDSRLEELIAELAGGTDAEPTGRDYSDQITEKWMVVIDCEDEPHQQQLLQEFGERGLACRALMS